MEDSSLFESSQFPFLDRLDLDPNVKSKMSMNLNRIMKGSSEVLRTPIGKSLDPSEILGEWDKVFQSSYRDLSSNLQGLESINREKFGPRSLAKPWSENKSSIEDSFQITDLGSDIEFSFPLEDKGKLRPLNLENASKKIKRATNSGLPYYTRKGLVLSRTLETFNQLYNRNDPCVLFTRTQEQNKTRYVWGFPLAVTLNESRYYFPLLEYQRGKRYRCALKGPSAVDVVLTELVNSVNSSDDYDLVSLDFSAFDATVQSIQRDCFSYIKYLFQEWSHEELSDIEDKFRTIEIVTPSGVLGGKHGVPSGSTFTNEVDSLAQYLVLLKLPFVRDFVIQGDDSVILIDKGRRSDLIEAFDKVGFVVNDEKSYTGEFAVYLQNLYDIDYTSDNLIGGIYPTYRALNRIIFQERWSNFEDMEIEGKDYYSIRTLSILENVKYHPLFKEFVQFIYNIDRYNLEFSETGLSKYIKMMDESIGSAGIINNQRGDDVRGIRNFASFKLIKEMG